ncbi:hypothetical protein WSM22_02900 [Cytophagales bacterium WSM2-2]|nr:hypothetical protein WSM22_02900 [Cytophagales bacterium WSM2-2]
MILKPAYINLVARLKSSAGDRVNFLPVWALLIALAMLSCKGSRILSKVELTSNVEQDSAKSTLQKKDSSSYLETVTEKTIPAQSIDANLGTQQRLDSMLSALKSMPKGITRTVYYTDPKTGMQLQLLLDSLGNLHARCTSIEKRYFERHVEQEKYISILSDQITKKKIQVAKFESENRELKKGFIARLKDAIKDFWTAFWLFVIAAGIVTIIGRFAIQKLKLLFPLINKIRNS